MKISKIIDKETGSGFGAHLFFNFDNEDFNSGSDRKRINEVCGWISNTFSEGFVLIERGDNLIAGGCVNNAEAWSDFLKDGKPIHPGVHSYELRCEKSDLTAFLLKYGEGI